MRMTGLWSSPRLGSWTAGGTSAASTPCPRSATRWSSGWRRRRRGTWSWPWRTPPCWRPGTRWRGSRRGSRGRGPSTCPRAAPWLSSAGQLLFTSLVLTLFPCQHPSRGPAPSQPVLDQGRPCVHCQGPARDLPRVREGCVRVHQQALHLARQDDGLGQLHLRLRHRQARQRPAGRHSR